MSLVLRLLFGYIANGFFIIISLLHGTYSMPCRMYCMQTRWNTIFIHQLLSQSIDRRLHSCDISSKLEQQALSKKSSIVKSLIPAFLNRLFYLMLNLDWRKLLSVISRSISLMWLQCGRCSWHDNFYWWFARKSFSLNYAESGLCRSHKIG